MQEVGRPALKGQRPLLQTTPGPPWPQALHFRTLPLAQALPAVFKVWPRHLMASCRGQTWRREAKRKEMQGCGMSQRTFKIKRPQACALKIRPSLPGREAPPAGPDSPLLPPHTQGLRLVSPVPGPALSRCLEPGPLRSCCPELGRVSETAGRSWDGGPKPAGESVCVHVCERQEEKHTHSHTHRSEKQRDAQRDSEGDRG